MPIEKLKSFLDNHKVKYVIISHSPAFTAQQIAASASIPGKELAKTVMIKIDGKMAMAVLSAPDRVDFNLLKKAVGAEEIQLADEEEFKDIFTDCEVGAMPPFGNLYNMTVFVSDKLAEDKEIVFNAGSHRELMKLDYEDYKEMVKPDERHFTAL